MSLAKSQWSVRLLWGRWGRTWGHFWLFRKKPSKQNDRINEQLSSLSNVIQFKSFHRGGKHYLANKWPIISFWWLSKTTTTWRGNSEEVIRFLPEPCSRHWTLKAVESIGHSSQKEQIQSDTKVKRKSLSQFKMSSTGKNLLVPTL